MRLASAALLGTGLAAWFVALVDRHLPWPLLLLAAGAAGALLAATLPRPATTAASPAARPTSGRIRVLDTSAIIDGRVTALVDGRLFDGALLIPDFVLQELQRVADSAERGRRERGREALQVAQRLIRSPRVRCSVHHGEGAGPVDDRLVTLCMAIGADLVTTDHNLQRVAEAQGVGVLNPNRLAVALRSPHRPGDQLRVHIVRPGREQGQGLATLGDGTLVVVEGGAGRVGSEVAVVVLREQQSERGRMLFARPDPSALDEGAAAT
jgi:uncharacterized protein YacL